MFNNFFKKTVKEEPKVTELSKEDQLLELRIQSLQYQLAEQKLMIRKVHKIVCMISEHQRFEPIQKELDVLKNLLDRIK
jgi:hypothetical protein